MTLSALSFQTFDQFTLSSVTKRWLFKGIMARGETSAWIAPPGGMKSALMAEASMCAAASGLDWRGKQSKGKFGVVYFALERADLLKRRLLAHRQLMKASNLPLAVVANTINLMTPRTVPILIDTLQKIELSFNVPIGLIVFDTFAKLIAAGGGDEDKARDQGAVFANIQRVREHVDAHVAIVGHTGKDVSRGARGSNAILGDADVMKNFGRDGSHSHHREGKSSSRRSGFRLPVANSRPGNWLRRRSCQRSCRSFRQAAA